MLEVAHVTLRPQLRGVNAAQRPFSAPLESQKHRLRRSPRSARCALDVRNAAAEDVQALEVRYPGTGLGGTARGTALGTSVFCRLHCHFHAPCDAL